MSTTATLDAQRASLYIIIANSNNFLELHLATSALKEEQNEIGSEQKLESEKSAYSAKTTGVTHHNSDHRLPLLEVFVATVYVTDAR